MDVHEAGDASLAVAMARGSQEALAEIYERHSGAVYEVAQRLGGELLAGKVVQQTFLDLWHAPEEFDPVSTLRSALLTRAHVAALEQMRRNRARAVDRHLPGGDDHPSIEAAGQAWPLLSRLATEEATAIWMTYFVGYSAAELALQLRQPERVIHQRVRDGLRHLRGLRETPGPPEPA